MKEIADVVVVGAGTAGCVVAARLSEDPGRSVLLIEAGGDDRRPEVVDPGRWADAQGTDADWGFASTTQRGTGRRYAVPRGRVLGGSGSINCMTHLRGDRADYDAWAELGAAGWDFAGVLPYFRRSEHAPDGDPRYRGTGGPLHPRVADEPHPAGLAYAEAAVRAGHARVDDFNGPELMGVGFTESLIVDGRRESTATAYLRPAMGRPNLAVLTGATVLGLTFAGERCTGVRAATASGVHEVSAGEVILCAGAVGSPQLLQLSGIGPAGVLEAAGVPVRHELPGVGERLQDHILVAGIRYRPERPFARTGQGATVFAGLGDRDPAPDLHLTLLGMDYHLPWQEPGGPDALTLSLGQMRPHGTGSVRIASADPAAAPRIDLGYLADERDLPALIRGLEQLDRIVRAGAFDEWGGEADTTRLLQLDRPELEAAIRAGVSSYFHLAGSCRMGDGSDAGAVVDPELRVRGLSGLRVADASIMPRIVSANTNAAAVMIGEKAADLILGRSERASSPHLERTQP